MDVFRLQSAYSTRVIRALQSIAVATPVSSYFLFDGSDAVSFINIIYINIRRWGRENIC